MSSTSIATEATDMMREAMEMQVATKILDGIVRLDDDFANSNRRWPWELLQNAHDASLGSALEVEVELGNKELVFRHNGRPFQLRNLTYLINQTSSKERAEKNEAGESALATIGKYGTGFMTTHLLSKVIVVEGVFENPRPPASHQRFSVTLDRSARSPREMYAGVTRAFAVFKDLDNPDRCPRIPDYVQGRACDTCFRYQLTDQASHEVARRGLDDFQLSIGFVFGWIPVLKKVTIRDRLQNATRVFQARPGLSLGGLRVSEVAVTAGNSEESFFVASATDGRITLARPIFRLPSGGFELRPRDRRVPSFFVDFPLVGSESFELPFLLQSHHFDPDEKRSAIYLGNRPSAAANKTLLAATATLFQNMMASLAHLQNSHLLAYFPMPSDPNIDKQWFKSTIHKPIRQILHDQPIFLNSLGKKIKIREACIFVQDSLSRGFELCKIVSPLFGAKLPYLEFDYYKFWHSVFDNEFEQEFGKRTQDLYFVYLHIQSLRNMNCLASNFGSSHEKSIEFLNALCAFDIMKEYKTKKNLQIFPDQKGQFCQLSSLSTDRDIPEPLKQIGNLFGIDFEAQLLWKSVVAETSKSMYPSGAAELINQNLFSTYSDWAMPTRNHWGNVQRTYSFGCHDPSQNSTNPQTPFDMSAVLRLTELTPKSKNESPALQIPRNYPVSVLAQEQENNLNIYELASFFFPIRAKVEIDCKEPKIWSVSDLIVVDQAFRVVEAQKSLQNLQRFVKKGSAEEALNTLYQFISDYPAKAVVPNRNGEFKELKKLKQNAVDQEIKSNEKLKNPEQIILALFNMYQLTGVDYKDTLVHEKVNCELLQKCSMEQLKKNDLVQKINEYINDEKNWKMPEFPLIFQNLSWLEQNGSISEFTPYKLKKERMYFELTPNDTKKAVTSILTKTGGQQLLESMKDLNEEGLGKVREFIGDPSFQKMISGEGGLDKIKQALVIQEKLFEKVDLTVGEMMKNQEVALVPHQAPIFDQNFFLQNNIANEQQFREFTKKRYGNGYQGFNFSDDESFQSFGKKRWGSGFSGFSFDRQSAYEYVRKILDRTVIKVTEYLKSLPEYDLSNHALRGQNQTILSKVKLRGELIAIVARPSDNNRFTIHAEDEVEALSSKGSELWTDNGRSKPWLITFGEIVRKNNLLQHFFAI